MPLLWVLRDTLGLTGTKYSCGEGHCRSCAVHVDGRLVSSCRMPLRRVEGADVTTIEGLAQNTEHPVIRAWIEEQVPQCGYCQSGQIMAAAALLRDTQKPSDEEIDSVMSRVLCRCGTYVRIRQAIHRAAGNDHVET